MRFSFAAIAVAGVTVSALGAAVYPVDIAGSRIGVSKADVLANSNLVQTSYANVRPGLESVTFLMATSEVVMNEQGTEYGTTVETVDEDAAQSSAQPSSQPSSSAKSGDKSSSSKRAQDQALPPSTELPASTMNKTVYKTLYFDKFSRVVAIQVSFENLTEADLKALQTSLDQKYPRDIQKRTDICTYSLSSLIKLESRVQPTAFRQIDGGRQQPTRYRIINFYFDAPRLDKTLRDTNQRNAIKMKDLI